MTPDIADIAGHDPELTRGAQSCGPRERMVRHAALLIGRNGVGATSIGDVIAASNAPRGSIYHHFPGGKTQLMTEAVRYAGEYIAAQLDVPGGGSARDAVTDICGIWRRMLVDSGYAFGCPVLAGGLARECEPAVADEAEATLTRWRRIIADRLVAENITPNRAESLSTLVLAAVEGGIGLTQTRRSIEPFDRVVAELADLTECAEAAA